MKYKMNLEINGTDMFAVVMKVVEGNRDIKVVSSEMIVGETVRKQVISRHRSDGKFEDKFYDSVKHKPGVIVTTTGIMQWCGDNGFSPSSATSISSLLVKAGKLERTDQRGHFKIKGVA